MRYNQIKAAQPDKQAGEFQTHAIFFFPFSRSLVLFGFESCCIYCNVKTHFLKRFFMMDLLRFVFHWLYFKGSTWKDIIAKGTLL